MDDWNDPPDQKNLSAGSAYPKPGGAVKQNTGETFPILIPLPGTFPIVFSLTNKKDLL
jgi:hypothetical protein